MKMNHFWAILPLSSFNLQNSNTAAGLKRPVTRTVCLCACAHMRSPARLTREEIRNSERPVSFPSTLAHLLCSYELHPSLSLHPLISTHVPLSFRLHVKKGLEHNTPFLPYVTALCGRGGQISWLKGLRDAPHKGRKG